MKFSSKSRDDKKGKIEAKSRKTNRKIIEL